MAVKITLTNRRKALVAAIVICLVVWIVYIINEQTNIFEDMVTDRLSEESLLLSNVKNMLNKAKNSIPILISGTGFGNGSSNTAKPGTHYGVQVLRDIYQTGFEVPLADLCSENGLEVKVLIVVTSAPQHVTLRMAIRQTWGHFDHRRDVVIAFIIGTQSDPKVAQQLFEENAVYNDIIVNKNVDTYRNLTLKTAALFEWVKCYCSKALFVLKTDDDMFINVPKLLTFISEKSDHINVIFGRLAEKWGPIRDKNSKYYVTNEEFQPAVFPNFVTGPAYLMSSDVPSLLYEASMNMTYMALEDVFFSGIVAEQVNIGRVSAPDFTNERLTKNDKCAVHKAIAFHMVPIREQYECWTELMNKRSSC